VREGGDLRGCTSIVWISMKFVFSTRLCVSCSPVEVMAVLISVLLSARSLGPGPGSFSA
jgi:hypothetical protein